MPSPKAPVQTHHDCPAMMLAPQASPAVTALTAEMVAPAPVADLAPLLRAEPDSWVSRDDAPQDSPPDLYLLNSTLLV
jgi:hypothetical protein